VLAVVEFDGVGVAVLDDAALDVASSPSASVSCRRSAGGKGRRGSSSHDRDGLRVERGGVVAGGDGLALGGGWLLDEEPWVVFAAVNQDRDRCETRVGVGLVAISDSADSGIDAAGYLLVQ
jgi:hypothetical protein